MTVSGNDFTLCPTGRGLAASRRPFGAARLPVGHSAGAGTPPLYQATHPKNEVSTLSGDLTGGCPHPPNPRGATRAHLTS